MMTVSVNSSSSTIPVKFVNVPTVNIVPFGLEMLP
jgi:hypothetical protein